jgi:hypothetical protein
MSFQKVGKTIAEIEKDCKPHETWNRSWIADPEGGDRGPMCQDLIKNRDKIFVIGEISDDEASYSYDDWALIKYKGKFYLLATSGCSCPSPRETWDIEKGPATLKQIRKHITDGAYSGYSMPKRQLDQFIEMLDSVC